MCAWPATAKLDGAVDFQLWRHVQQERVYSLNDRGVCDPEAVRDGFRPCEGGDEELALDSCDHDARCHAVFNVPCVGLRHAGRWNSTAALRVEPRTGGLSPMPYVVFDAEYGLAPSVAATGLALAAATLGDKVLWILRSVGSKK